MARQIPATGSNRAYRRRLSRTHFSPRNRPKWHAQTTIWLIGSLTSVALMLMVTSFLVANQDGPAATSGEQEPTDVEPDTPDAEVTQGALRIADDDGSYVECPLKHTDVRAEISGFIARVTVVQSFENPSDEPIEAVYVFPLPNEAAVDDMTMVLGERRIEGQIKKKDEARLIYERAVAAGQTASLLEQERPNIFTQSVGNIQPGEEIRIEISYVDVLKYDMGEYEFQFPMVVGPRYNPSGGDRPADADRINAAPILTPEQRNGHDISLHVELDAGVPIKNIKTVDHEVFLGRPDDRKASVSLSPLDNLPNKDFVMRYNVAGEKPEVAVLSHTGDYSHDAKRLGKGYFMLMIQPSEEREELAATPPREIVFLLDVSGSMRGAKTDQVKSCMRNMLGLCREEDRFQVVTFASQANKLFESPVPVNEKTIREALAYNEASQSGGGTEMIRGVRMAMDEPIEDDRMRIIVMLTDGFIGNEAQIIEHVGKKCGDQIRFWTVGVDASPNMFLIDGVARQGGGMGKRLGPNESAEPLAAEIMTRIQRAQLAKVSLDFGDLEVKQTYPAQIPELWAGRPVIVYGRYTDGGDTTVTVNGMVEGKPMTWTVDVSVSDEEPGHDVLAKTWARQKIEDLMQQSYYMGSPAIEEEVTAIALNYRMMSQYTSFVAVDSTKMEDPNATPPRRITVPIPLPAYNEWEGYFGSGIGGDVLMDSDDGAMILGGAVVQNGNESLAELTKLATLESKSFSGARYKQELGSFGYANGPVSGGIALGNARGFARGGGGGGGFGGGGLGGGGFGGQAWGANGPGAPMQLGRGLGVASTRGRRRLSSTSSRGLQAASGLVLPQSSAPVDAFYAIPLAEGRYEESRQLLGQGQMAYGSYLYDVEELVRIEDTPLATATKSLLEEAAKAFEEGDLETSSIKASQAYYLAIIAVNSGEDATEMFNEASELMVQIREKRLEELQDEFPQIEERIDLLLRDISLTEALQAWSSATGIKVTVVEGSIDDAAKVLGLDELHIEYADLRNVVAKDALTWLVEDNGMEFRIDDETVTVGTRNRISTASSWVYNISSLATPIVEELENIESDEDKQKYIADNADQLIGKIKELAKLSNQCRISWFGPGQILMIAPRSDHLKLDEFHQHLLSLEIDDENEENDLVILANRCQAFEARLAIVDKQARLLEANAVAQVGAIQLLTAAAAGELDLEALTHLQIAWATLMENVEDTSKLSQLHASAWMITEAARALPEEVELVALSEKVLEYTEDGAIAAFATFQETPEEITAMHSAIFASLARGKNSEFSKGCIDHLAGDASDRLDSIGMLSLIVLGMKMHDQERALESTLSAQPSSAVEAMLLAMVCYQQQGESWEKFRQESPSFLSQIDPSGNVSVFANRVTLEYVTFGG